jgi:DNA-directed RNA polymerase subunit RPC12/RpoP
MDSFEDLFDENGLVTNWCSIIRDNQTSDWLEKVYKTWGKSVTQKIYNYKNHITKVPVCQNCGKPLNFISFNSGYGVVCKECSEKIKKENNIEDIDVEKITKGHPKVLEVEEDFSKASVQSNIITSLKPDAKEEDILKEHGLDPKVWKIIKIRHSIWDNYSNKKGTQQLYASKIYAEKRELTDITPEQMMQKLDSYIKYEPKAISSTIYNKNEKVIVIPIADLHFGLLASSTSKDKYNMDIAEKRVKEFLEKLDSYLATFSKKDHIILTLGNDFFNADNLVGTTTKGTQQNQETNYFDIFDRGVELAISIIENIKKYTNDLAIYSVQSNHDKVTSHALIRCLSKKYENNKEIKIHCEEDKKSRFYIKAGKNLFGFGHETNLKDCERLMSTEAGEYWSSTTYKTFFIAHLHHEEVNEVGSVTVRRLPILSGDSAWSNEMGYVGSLPRSQAFVFDSEKGLEQIINVNVV